MTSCAAVFAFGCGDSDSPSDDSSVTKRIGPEGGEVKLADGAGVTIPEGALEEAVDITVSRLSEADAEALAAFLDDGLTLVSDLYAFTPHGQQFLVPVEMTVPYDSTSNALAMQRLDDEDDTSWTEEQGTTFADSVASLETEHFSIEGVTADDRRADAGMDASTDAGDEPRPDSGTDSSMAMVDSGSDATTEDDSGAELDSGSDAATVSDVLVRFTAGNGTTTITGELPGTPFGVEDNRPSDIFQGDVIFPLSDGTEIVVTFCDGGYLVTDGCGVNAIPNLPAGTYDVFMRGEFLSAIGTILTTNSLPFTIANSGSNQWVVQLSTTVETAGNTVDVYGVGEMGAGNYKAILTPNGGSGTTEATCTFVAGVTGHCTFTVPSIATGLYDVVIQAGTGSDAVQSGVKALTIN